MSDGRDGAELRVTTSTGGSCPRARPIFRPSIILRAANRASPVKGVYLTVKVRLHHGCHSMTQWWGLASRQ